jgi:hypothetical protein
MRDFTRILQDYCSANNISYHYGRMSNLNLLRSDLVDGQVYLLHEASPRRAIMNTTKTLIEKYEFVGKFFLVVKSNLDQHYFNEKQGAESESKYEANIEPLLNLFESIGNTLLGCGDDYEVNQWECIDVVNVLDVNKDGVLVTYNVTSYE